jgi:peptidoglycan-associated lipoprotein
MIRNVTLILLVCVVCLGLLLGGCQKKPPEPDYEAIVVPTNTPIAAPTPEPGPTAEELRLIKLEEARKVLTSETVYFDYDKSALTDSARSILAEKASYLVRNPDILVTIEGHCDERGSNEYNLALGERRASSVKQYLANFGVSSDNIDTLTYGEERPVCSESNESCWRLNRRAVFVVND